MTQELKLSTQEMRQEALDRAHNSQSSRNWMAAIDGFKAKGIPEDEIKPTGMFAANEANVFTFHAWKAKGRRVVKRPDYLQDGEKWVVPLITYIDGKRSEVDPTTGEETETRGSISKTVYVFHVTQTVPLDYPNKEQDKIKASANDF